MLFISCWSDTNHIQLYKYEYSTLSENSDQECPGHDFLMSRSAVHYVSSKSEA